MKTKRLLDLVLSAVGLFCLAPLFGFLAVAIKGEDGGPVFFRQWRTGLYGRPFRIWKFRTMSTEKSGPEVTVGEDSRITRVGKWLRAGKLDELPQLINVLMGEMTLVGPRPEVPSYTELYTADQRKVLDFVPGITDPASLLYYQEAELLADQPDPLRYYIDTVMPDKIRINLDYAKSATVWSDFEILLRTLFRPLFFRHESARKGLC